MLLYTCVLRVCGCHHHRHNRSNHQNEPTIVLFLAKYQRTIINLPRNVCFIDIKSSDQNPFGYMATIFIARWRFGWLCEVKNDQQSIFLLNFVNSNFGSNNKFKWFRLLQQIHLFTIRMEFHHFYSIQIIFLWVEIIFPSIHLFFFIFLLIDKDKPFLFSLGNKIFFQFVYFLSSIFKNVWSLSRTKCHFLQLKFRNVSTLQKLFLRRFFLTSEKRWTTFRRLWFVFCVYSRMLLKMK